jgi:hypothetical protein
MTQPGPDQGVQPSALRLPALNIGIWEDTPHVGRVRGDATMARIFGLSEAEAERGVSWEQLSAIFHPEDLALDATHRRRVRDEGGLFAWEHRIIPTPGVVRWVLARGRFERGSDGLMHGSGIVIDVTDIRTDAALDHPAGFLGAAEEEGTALERMAAHAVRMWDLMRELDAEDAARVQPVIRPLLHELGRRIAASLTRRDGSDFPEPRSPQRH